MPTFHDRKESFDWLGNTTPVLANVYGEAGIGKSCLLEEYAR